MKSILKAFILSIFISNIAIAQDTDLLLYLPLNNTTSDFSANKYHIDGDVTEFVADKDGNANCAASFDGTNYLIMEGATNFKTLSAYTLSVLVKPSKTKAAQYIISKASPGRDMMLAISANNKFNSHIVAGENGAYQWCENPDTYNVDQWYHLASVYDGTTLKLYVDGTLVKTLNVTSTPDWNGNYLSIASLGGDYRFSGIIDEVKIYKKAFQASDIQSLAQTSSITTDVNDELVIASSVKLYPNPAKNQITVSGTKGNFEIVICDIQSNPVAYFNGNTNNNYFNISALDAGFYVVKIIAENGTTSRKLIVE